MIYKLGRIGVGEGMALLTMIELPHIYLSEPSITIGFVGSSVWLIKLMGGLMSLGIFLAMLYFYQKHVERVHQGKLIDFYQFTKELLGNKIAICVFVAWAIFFEIQTALTLREFADYIVITTLTANRLIVITLLLAICMVIVLYTGLEVILRTAYVLFFVAGIGIIVVILLLSPYLNVDYLVPWQGHGLSQVVRYSFFDVGTWLSGVAIFAVIPALENLTTVRRVICYGLSYTVFLKTILTVSAIMLFGTVIAPERALIFYEMVQAINLSQYLQRVDAIFIVIWLTGGLISTILLQFFSLHFICKPFKLRDFKVLIPIAVLLSVALSMMPSSVIEAIELNQFFSYSVSGAFLFFNVLIFGIGHLVKGRRQKPWAGEIN